MTKTETGPRLQSLQSKTKTETFNQSFP